MLINRLTEKLWQQIKQVYEDNGRKVAAEVDKKIINFLDVILDLATETHRHFMKPNSTLLNINSLSNLQEHPPGGEQKAPSALLAVVEPYQEALDRAGYDHQVLFQEPDPPAAAAPSANARTRVRKVTWFNLPFSQSISTQKFLHLVDASAQAEQDGEQKLILHHAKHGAADEPTQRKSGQWRQK